MKLSPIHKDACVTTATISSKREVEFFYKWLQNRMLLHNIKYHIHFLFCCLYGKVLGLSCYLIFYFWILNLLGF